MASGQRRELGRRRLGQVGPLLAALEGVAVGGRQRVGCAVEPEAGRRAESLELPPPAALGRVPILPLQPGDEVLERAGRRQAGDLAADERLVGDEELLEQQLGRPAVQDQVVDAPDALVAVVGQPDHDQPHQRRPGEVEGARAVGGQQRLQARLLLRPRRAPPVVLLPG